MLAKHLRRLALGTYNPEYDVGGVLDPFLQSALLQTIAAVAVDVPMEELEVVSTVLAHIATNTELARNAGNAVLYECVRTILVIDSAPGTRST